jgi:hypothetical protein
MQPMTNEYALYSFNTISCLATAFKVYTTCYPATTLSLVSYKMSLKFAVLFADRANSENVLINSRMPHHC